MVPRKHELVQAAVRYLADRGIADLSLRSLAAATGTSARLLIYHFGSKERLLAEVLAALQGRLRDSFSEVLAAQNPSSYARYLKRNSRDWIELVQAALPPEERSAAMATLLVAVFDGLFLELMSTGDRKRTTAALDEFVRVVRRGRGNKQGGSDVS
jgi:AcrR family transcriptional regulator